MNVNFEKGLSGKEAEKLLEKYGPNVLPETPPPSDLSIVLSQVKSPLVYILIFAGVVTFILGEVPDTVIIFLAVFINTILGFIQERRAGRALSALKQILHPKTKVIRNGKEEAIDVEEIVPGDIAVLTQGEKVPADGVLVEANRLFVDEAVLTGESMPVGKTVIQLSVINSQLSDGSWLAGKTETDKPEIENRKRKTENRVYMGTIVSAGRGLMRVETTGAKTEIGKIAKSIQEPSEDTPLKKQLKKFSKQLSVLVLILVSFVFMVGVLKGFSVAEIFETSVALAVSSIPEGILVGLTIVLAIGMQRILKRKGLVRNLVSAETLGGVTTICIDKTGTLTEGKMQVTDFVGNEADLALQMVLANDLDDPLTTSAFEWAKKKLGTENSELRAEELLKKYDQIDSIPFSSEDRFFASLNFWNDKNNTIFVNGAPEFLLEWSNLDKEEKASVFKKINSFTKQGKRVLGLARKSVAKSKRRLSKRDVKSDLEWVGILAFADPVRSGVKQALEKTEKAGIKLVVITGDYAQTAVSVMNQLGIKTSNKSIMTGEELNKIKIENLSSRLLSRNSVNLFARTTPQQKFKIVEALKKKGEIVAMMGDGVNDAPALKKADIGIVVGEATDVAKESADLVLLDSSFATIVSAIEEGRGIFDNIRKIILYLMSDSFEEIIAVIASIIAELPLPVTAVQILWINLVSDGFPNMALTFDPKENEIMSKSPRSPQEKVISSWMKKLIVIVSLSGGAIAFALFTLFYKTTDSLAISQSIAFATLGINSLVYVFSIRTLTNPFWRRNPFKNKWLNLAVLAGFFLQVLPFTSPSLREFFSLTSLSFSNWIIVFAASFFMFIIIEISKVVFQRSMKESSLK